MNKNISSKKRINRYFVVSIVALFVFVFTFLCVIDGFSKIKAKNKISEREKVAVTIGEYSFSVSDLELFCATVVSGENYEEIENSAGDKDELNTLIKAKALTYMRQYAVLCQEAAANEITLSSLEKFEITENSQVDNNGKTLEGDALQEYYRENYGVSYERYLEIKEGFALGEKYLKQKAEEISYSEDKLKQIFNDNIEKMAWASCDIIYIPLTSKDDGVNQLKINTAENTAKSLNECDEASLSAMWSNAYATYNESGFSNSKNNTIVYGSICEDYPELFECVCDETINGFNAIVSGDAVFIIKVNERHLYDYFKDSAALSDLAFETAASEVLAKLLKKSKYEPITTSAYLKYEFLFA